MRLRRAAAVLVGVMGVLSCAEPGAAPGTTWLDIRAALASQPTTPVAIDRVRAEIIRPPADVIASDERTVTPGQTSVEMGLRVTLNEEQEQLVVRISMWSGDLLRYRGESTMLVDASQAINESPIVPLFAVAPVLDVPDDELILGGRPGTEPATQTFSITNGGGEVLNWSATSDQTWLGVSPASGALRADETATITATADMSVLEPGVHRGNITVSAPGAAGAPVVVPVEVQVEAEQAFTVAPASLTFTTSAGVAPAPQTLRLTNGTFAPVAWTITDDAPWLTVAPATGTVASGATETVTAEISAAGLPPGSYSGTITVVPEGGAVTSVPVSLTITAPRPTIRLTPTQLAFTAQAGTTPEPATLEIGNAGAGILSWTATEEAPWLTLGATTGAVPAGASQAVPVSVSTAGLAAGTYNAVITVTDPTATNSPQTATVQLTVTAAPTFALTVLGGGTGQGNVNRQNGAISCSIAAGVATGTCTETLAAGTAVTLVAVPQANSAFTGWSGACTGTGECQVTMDQARTVTATFDLTPARLAVAPDTLEFVSQVDSAALPQPLTITNQGGQTLNWTATADAPWVNVPASGSVPAGGNAVVPVAANTAGLAVGNYSAAITVSAPGATDSPRTIVVRLTITAAPTYALTVQGAGTGQGTVVRQGGLLNCSINAGVATGTCAQSYAQGTVVTLDVIPVANSTFTGWTGACTGTGVCEVTMDQARTVTAGFALIPPALAVTPDTLTYVTQEGVNPASQQMQIANTGGTSFDWTAAPSAPWVTVPGSGSVPWGGVVGLDVGVNAAGLAVGSHEATITVTAPGATDSPQTVVVRLTVTAIPTYALTVQGSGNGEGAVVRTAGGINCGINAGATSGTCQQTFTQGTVVTLSAVPVPNSTFTGWSGACTGTGTCQVTMDQARTVTAGFTLIPAGLLVLPDTLTFVTQAGTSPAAQQMQIFNTGGTTLNWSTSVNQPWVSVPANGSIPYSGSAVLDVVLNTAALAVGSHQATITVDAPGATNAPRVVVVRLTVTAIPTFTLTVQGAGTGFGSITDNTGGIDCTFSNGSTSGDCTESYQQGTVVTVQTSSLLGAPPTTFTAWSGACTGSGACNVSMTTDRSVTATFALVPAGIGLFSSSLNMTAQEGPNVAQEALSLVNTGGATLNWSASADVPWLSLAPSSGSLAFDIAQGIDVFANADGLAQGTYQGTLTFTAAGASNSPQEVSVEFTVTAGPTHTVTILGAGTGDGGVTADVGSIACAILAGVAQGDCSETYPEGTVVNLQATTEANAEFVGWSGACTGSSATCNLTMNADAIVTATFVDTTPVDIFLSEDSLAFPLEQEAQQNLLVELTRTPGATVVNWSLSSDAAWLTADPTSGTLVEGASEFLTVTVNTTGLAVGNYAGTLTVTSPDAANSPRTMLINLTVDPLVLALNVQGAGTGSGTVTSDVGAINCSISFGAGSGTCGTGYNLGTVVTLTAQPDANSTFVEWSGACTGSGTCQVTMDQTQFVTATFNHSQSLVVQPGALDFSAEEGSDPDVDYLDITALDNLFGVGWTANYNAPWLQVAPQTGNLSGTDVSSLEVSVASSSLAVGTYVDTIFFTSPDVVNSPQFVTVTLEITPALGPTLSNPSVQLTTLNDEVYCSTASLPSSLFAYTFDYTDPDGDVSSNYELAYLYPDGTSGGFADTASLSGDGYSGTATMEVCVPFNGFDYVTLYFTLFDGLGHASNQVGVVTDRPEGANGTLPDVQSATRVAPKPATGIERRIIRQ